MDKTGHYGLLSLILFITTITNSYGQRLSDYKAKAIIRTLTKNINEKDTTSFRKLWYVNNLINFSDCQRLKDDRPPYLPTQCIFLTTDKEIKNEFVRIEKQINTWTSKNPKANIKVTKLSKQYKSKYGLTHKIKYTISDTSITNVINFYMTKKDSDWLIMTTTEIE